MDITSAILDPGPGCTSFTAERITCTENRRKKGKAAVTYPSGASPASVYMLFQPIRSLLWPAMRELSLTRMLPVRASTTNSYSA